MQIKNYSFQQLPFSDLFKNFTADFDSLSEFYAVNPFSDTEIRSFASSFSFAGNRSASVDILQTLNKKYEVHEKALQNIKRLEQSRALAIVTGQQLGVYGGPLFTILKTISTIHLATRMEKLLDQPVIPVFWLADEDHDYDEIRSLTVLNKDDPQTFSLPAKTGVLPPVAELSYTDAIRDLRRQLKEAQFETDFSEELWSLLDANFTAGTRFDRAFGGFIADLFSKYGLVLAGSNHPKVKQLSRECMRSAVQQADEIRNALQKQTQVIGKKYKQQVTLFDSNLFYLDEGSGRVKISRNGEGWKTAAGQQWDTDELLAAIESEPERFSPNVFLRPLMQDYLLPTLGYVAGPGEVAYYGQMKQMYKCLDMQMPVVFPRLSATLIEPPISRILDEVPFEIYEFGQRIEDLESEFVDRTGQTDIEALFVEWEKKAGEVSKLPIQKITEIDPTLEASAEKALAKFANQLNRLKGKVYRSVKDHEETQIKRIRRIQNHLFPNRGLQERTIAGIYFMNLYGVDIWDHLLNALDEDDTFKDHKLIYL